MQQQALDQGEGCRMISSGDGEKESWVGPIRGQCGEKELRMSPIQAAHEEESWARAEIGTTSHRLV